MERPVFDVLITEKEWEEAVDIQQSKEIMLNIDEFSIHPDPKNEKLAQIHFGRGHITIRRAELEKAIYEYHLAIVDLEEFCETKELALTQRKVQK